jgi:hypothetical protein
MSTISDRKQGIKPFNNQYSYYHPIIKSATDYYAFGSPIEDRMYQADGYRYGFGGHEKNDEINGSGNHLSFGDYGYDSRIGRRWNVDPLSNKYPNISPYSSFNNNPIIYKDPDGNDAIISITPGENGNNGTIVVTTIFYVEKISNDLSRNVKTSFNKTWGNNSENAKRFSTFRGNAFKDVEINGQKFDVIYQVTLKEQKMANSERREGTNTLIDHSGESSYGSGELKYNPGSKTAKSNTVFGHELAHVLGIGHNTKLVDGNGKHSISSYDSSREVITQDIINSLEGAVKLANGQQSLMTLVTGEKNNDLNTVNLKDKLTTTQSLQYPTAQDPKQKK